MLKLKLNLDAWACLFLVALPCLLFWPALFSGKLIFGYDTLALGIPFSAAIHASLAAHQWPLWLSGVNGGMPGLAACNLAFAYPSDFLGCLAGLPLPLRLGLDATLHVAIAGLGMYALLRRLSLRSSACLLGALFFALSGSETSQIQGGYYNFVEGVAWVPWAFWAAHKARHHGSAFHWGLCGAFLALQVLAGGAQLCFYTMVPLACFALSPAWGPPQKFFSNKAFPHRAPQPIWLTLAGLSLALAFCCVLSAPQLWPTLRYLPLSGRHGYQPGSLARGSIRLAEALTWLAPGCLGWSGATYHGSLALRFSSDYFGLLPWALALAALTARGLRDAKTRWLVGLALLSLLLAQRNWAPFLNLFQHLPLLRGFRDWHRVLFLVTFAVCVLAAQGWQACLDPQDHIRARRGALLFWPLAALGLFCAWHLAVARARAAAPTMPWLATDPSRVGALLLAQARDSLRSSAMLLMPGLALTLCLNGRTRFPALLLVAAMSFHGLDWAQTLSRFIRFENPRTALTRTHYVQSPPAAPAQEPWRVFDADERQPNVDLLWGYENLAGTESLPLQAYLRTQAALQTRPWGWQRWLDLMGVRFVFRHSRTEPYLPGDLVSITPNPSAYPRAWLVGKTEVVSDEAQAYALLAARDFNPRREAALSVNLGLSGVAPNGAVRWLSRSPLAFSLDVNTDRPAALLVSNFWYPAWKVSVDGKKSPLLKADGALQAVAVPQGRHRIDFWFSETLFNEALAACLVGLALLAGLLWIEYDGV